MSDDLPSTPGEPSQPVRRTFEELIARARALSEREDPFPGVDQITEGLEALTIALADRYVDGDERLRTRVEVVAQGALGVLSLLEEELPTKDHAAPLSDPASATASSSAPPAKMGLEQFISAFRNEAQKRLSGLSISMMTLFNELSSERALEDSAHHLHAIRGGAAMLSLTEVAAVAGLMEQVLVTMRKLPPQERVWPTTTLMSGFRLLQSAAADPDAFLSAEDAAPIKQDLSRCFEALLDVTTLDELSRPTRQASAPRAPAPPLAAELDLFEAARRAELDQPTEYDETFAQTASLDGMEQRLLIVDDVEMIAASIGFVLSELELPMDIASHGKEALAMLKERPYSLIISDIAMPHMDGLTLTSQVRADASLEDIPLILLTSLDHPRERETGFKVGANDYIIKGSIGGGELVHRVRELLKIAPFVPSDAPPRRPRSRILVAEDAETVAASIAFLLAEGDYDITITSNGHEALTRMEREDFDLLLSDWQMPSMSGYELTRAVRASAHIRQIPIVLLTSMDSDKVKQDAREAGADDFLVKGEIGGGGLLSVIDGLLRRDLPEPPPDPYST